MTTSLPKAFVVFQEQKKREREASVFPRPTNHVCFWYVSFSHLSFFLFVFYWLLLNVWLDHHHRVPLLYFSRSYDLSILWLSSWFVGLHFHNFFFNNHHICIGFSAICLLLSHALLWIYRVWQGNAPPPSPHFSCANDVGIIHQKRERNYGCGIMMIKGHGCSLHWCLRRNIKGLWLKSQKRATLVWQPSFCWYNNIHYLIQTYWRSI